MLRFFQIILLALLPWHAHPTFAADQPKPIALRAVAEQTLKAIIADHPDDPHALQIRRAYWALEPLFTNQPLEAFTLDEAIEERLDKNGSGSVPLAVKIPAAKKGEIPGEISVHLGINKGVIGGLWVTFDWNDLKIPLKDSKLLAAMDPVLQELDKSKAFKRESKNYEAVAAVHLSYGQIVWTSNVLRGFGYTIAVTSREDAHEDSIRFHAYTKSAIEGKFKPPLLDTDFSKVILEEYPFSGEGEEGEKFGG